MRRAHPKRHSVISYPSRKFGQALRHLGHALSMRQTVLFKLPTRSGVDGTRDTRTQTQIRIGRIDHSFNARLVGDVAKDDVNYHGQSFFLS